MKSIIGTVLRERYYIAQELGRGGFSITYLAEDRDLPGHPRCIVKRLQPQLGTHVLGRNSRSWQSAQKRFITEAVTLQRLGKHPQIPQLLAYFEENKEFYLVQEFIDGENLEQEVKQHLLSETQAIALLQEVLKILDFVHQQNVIHRDIKPSNLIRRSNDGKIFLIDFGAVKDITLPPELQKSANSTKIIGTQGYMPPEQLEGNPNITSDLYALGKTAIYALTGQLPPDQGNSQTIELNNDRTLPQEETTINMLTQISPRLSNILNKMVCYRYQERYQSAIEVLTDLEREQNFITLPPPFLVSPPYVPNEQFESIFQRPKQPRKKSKFILWLVLILPFLGALLTIIIGINKNRYQGFLPYTNNNYHIQIKYPENWTVRELEDPITGEVVVFSSPKESGSDIFQEKVFITVEKLPNDITNLDEYSTRIISGTIANKDTTISVYNQKESRLSRQPARTLVYSRSSGNLNLRQKEVFTFHNDQAYIITYSAERAKYSKFLNEVKKMIESFRIDTPPQS
ncbi:protein kinase [Pleurocapsales cyanobacterium LEGE 06147]|nr:protein kinase [Pleurocapsales cyanobacterium LEGE 06147]